jgi:hypothetical protein
MSLDTYALTDLDNAISYLGGISAVDALWIQYVGSSSTATVEVQESNLVLTDSSAHTIDLTNANYDTIAELIAYINANLTGWQAGRLCHSDDTVANLLVTGSLDAKGSENQQTLKISSDYLITELINRASSFIERYCNRKLLSRAYTRECYDGNGHTRLMLKNYPVTQVTRISVGRTNAFTVKCSATTYAFFEVTPTSVKLNRDGTTTTLTISTYSTINDLIAAINAVSGSYWTATLINTDYGSYKASEVLVRPALYCKSPDMVNAEIPNDEVSDFFVEQAEDDFNNPGILYAPGGFTAGHQNIFCDYTAGFTTIPYVLEQVCLELVKLKYDQAKQSFGIAHETLGDYAYTAKDIKGLPEDMRAELDLFKRRIL